MRPEKCQAEKLLEYLKGVEILNLNAVPAFPKISRHPGISNSLVLKTAVRELAAKE